MFEACAEAFVNSISRISAMGKPGKWIKNVLFGKKASKSNFAKGKEKPANEKEMFVRTRTLEAGEDSDPVEVSTGPVNPVQIEEHNSMPEYREAPVAQRDRETPVSGNENADANLELDMLTDAEIVAQEKAATKTQAAFRGYLARRAFKALKGIIRLQALIRGHLVRRQAVSTLYCIIAIVKFQAVVRGSRIRCSGAGLEVQKICIVKPLDGKIRGCEDGMSAYITSLSANAFIRKLLAPSPTMMALRVQYEVTDPNSVQNWLERWSLSCPWKRASAPKKTVNARVQKKVGNLQATEVETGRPKRSVRKVPSVFDNSSVQATSELEKTRRNPRKVSSHPSDSVQETPQNELEKVKRNLRKVHNPVNESSGKPEVVEKPAQIQSKAIGSIQPQDVPAPNEVNPAEKTKDETSMTSKEGTVAVSKPTEEKTVEEIVEANEHVEFSNDDKAKIKTESFEVNEKDENTPVANGELKPREESMNENQKSSRRASFPAKPEHIEDGLQNTPKLPSYMQATESVKAKLRGQGSPRLGQDGAEKNNSTRRHSLPSSTNGKVSSASPRTPKPLQGNGKGGNKSEKSLSASKDGSGKAGQAQWRR